MKTASSKDFDYKRAGIFQFAIAWLAWGQAFYWFKIGYPQVVSAGKVPLEILSYMNWACAIISIFAVIFAGRGAYLYYKGTQLERTP